MEHPFILKRLLYGVKRNPARVSKMERPADEDLQPTDSTTRGGANPLLMGGCEGSFCRLFGNFAE